jgi:uncharacterized protein YyaL (SSP411 family)
MVAIHVRGDRLVRTSRSGTAGPSAGVLEDYADVAEGFLSLYAVAGETRWLSHARGLLDSAITHFSDGTGGFFDSADDATDPALARLRRPRDPTDNATPTGQSAVAGSLLTLAAYTGSQRYREAAERALHVVSPLAERAPRFAGWGLAVAEALADGPREVAVIGERADPATQALWRTALRGTAPGLAVAWASPYESTEVELLKDRPLVAGRPAAYVCRRFVCQRPVGEPAELAALVAARETLDSTDVSM